MLLQQALLPMLLLHLGAFSLHSKYTQRTCLHRMVFMDHRVVRWASVYHTLTGNIYRTLSVFCA